MGQNTGVTWLTDNDDNEVCILLVDNTALDPFSHGVFAGSYDTLKRFSIYEFPITTGIIIEDDIDHEGNINYWFLHTGNQSAYIVFDIRTLNLTPTAERIRNHISEGFFETTLVSEKYFDNHQRIKISIRPPVEIYNISDLIIFAEETRSMIRQITDSAPACNY